MSSAVSEAGVDGVALGAGAGVDGAAAVAADVSLCAAESPAFASVSPREQATAAAAKRAREKAVRI